MRWWRIKRRMSLDWMVNWSLVVIVVSFVMMNLCFGLDFVGGFVKHWTWKWPSGVF